MTEGTATKGQKETAVRRNGIRALVHNLAGVSNVKFFNHSSDLSAVAKASMTAMKYWVSFLYVKRNISSGSADIVHVIFEIWC